MGLQDIFDPVVRAYYKNHGGGGETSGYWDAFWDAYQNNGLRTQYVRAFNDKWWSDASFKPKYDIIPVGSAESMFQISAISDIRAETVGVTIDFSAVTSMMMAFYSASIMYTGTINLRSATSLRYAFNGCKAVSIGKLILPEVNVTDFTAPWKGMDRLEHITFEGTFPNFNIEFQDSPLTVDSMKSIIACLPNNTGTNNEFSCQLKFSENCWSKLESSGPYPNGGAWADYVNSLGWLT